MKRLLVGVIVISACALVACAHTQDLSGSSADARAWASATKERDAKEREQQQQAQRSQPIAVAAQRPAVPSKAPPPLPSPVLGIGPTQAKSSVAAAPASGNGRRFAVGTCFAIDGTGTLVTAHHVIEGSTALSVMFPGGELIPAQVVKGSGATDIAILKIAVATPEYLSLAAPHSTRIGQPVFTVGFPALRLLGIEPKFTDGSVSALSGAHDEATVMQISVPLQPGNSGGPVVSDNGEVVGIAVARANDSKFYDETGSLPQNINFAAKAETVQLLLPMAPPARLETKTRQSAIDRAVKAVCLVVAER